MNQIVKLHTSDHGVYVDWPDTEALTLHHQLPACPGATTAAGFVVTVSEGLCMAGSESI
jgi:hypothetical protein